MRAEAEAWLRQAERDLVKAENDLKTGDWDGAAFWSQQAAEKALKALLLNAGYPARGHNLLALADAVRRELGLDVTPIMSDLRELTIHYTIARYPNAANAIPYELYDEAKARDLVGRARRVLEWVRQHLQ
ncbi:MAG: HEPN domain-containing protein [Desulfurococcales archaeon]|nr:HEPN domain-containing protein [Desulfurococcales archaeon]